MGMLCSSEKEKVEDAPVAEAEKEAEPETLESKVDGFIANNGIAVFSKTWCGYSKRVKQAISDVLKKDEFKSLNMAVMELDQTDDAGAYQNYLSEKTGGRTVPRVFVGGEFVGGCDGTIDKIRGGTFQEQLKKLLPAEAEEAVEEA